MYGDKVTSLERFAAGFRRLSPACQKRLTVEVSGMRDKCARGQDIPVAPAFTSSRPARRQCCRDMWNVAQVMHTSVKVMRLCCSWSMSRAAAEELFTSCPRAQNDDIANSYSLEDLLTLHKDIRVPLVFDFHHHKCGARARQPAEHCMSIEMGVTRV